MTDSKRSGKRRAASVSGCSPESHNCEVALRKTDINVCKTDIDDTVDRSVAPDIGRDRVRFPIVGLGASAGGLSAFEEFFAGMPTDPDPGMAFVLVQHLAPDHKSLLSELVRHYTRMQVLEVVDGVEVKKNCAYIIPPGHDMALVDGTLQLLDPATPRGQRLPIDFFFRSIADEQRERAICIVFSGTGSDGTQGLRFVKAEGGLVIVQDPASAEYDGMPRSALATGLADYVLRPGEMPAQLIAYAAHFSGRRFLEASVPNPATTDALKRIAIVLRDQTGHDFSQYKRNTLGRRIERRMAVHQIEDYDDYLLFLGSNTAEGKALFRDLLIGVTSFFRDPDAFAALRAKVIPQLLAGKPEDVPVRIWVCGCASGQEAYSIAILLLEHLETLERAHSVQLFATDLDGDAIAFAREGVYLRSIANEMSADRLQRFFTRVPGRDAYRINRVVRDILVFSEQDVTKDPPFSKLDLITCRNLLIYWNRELQSRLVTLFHYALNPGGFLFLGTSESVGSQTSLFSVVDRKQKLFRMTPGAPLPPPSLARVAPRAAMPAVQQAFEGDRSRSARIATARELTELSLLAHYRSAAVLVNAQGDVVYVHGRTGRFLEPAEGEAAMNAISMARDGLRPALTSALHRAVNSEEAIAVSGVRVRPNGVPVIVNVTVRPAERSGGIPGSDLYVVILEEAPAVPGTEMAEAESAVDGLRADTFDLSATAAKQRIVALEKEVRTKDEYLQSTIEEMETANEELRSTNEDKQSVNEELQSTNEELETSKEELQSLNEELATVNAELQAKVADLSLANNDMNNLLAGTGLGTLFVDRDLCIARFTPAITEAINLIQSDVGRPVAHVVSNFVGYDRWVEDIQGVLDDLIPREVEVQIKSGKWYMIRLRPYRTLENVIEGAVIVFVDITERRRQEALSREARRFSESVVASIRQSLLVLDRDCRVELVNPAFCSRFHVSKNIQGQSLFELANGYWDFPEVRAMLAEALAQEESIESFELRREIAHRSRRMLLSLRLVRGAVRMAERILFSIDDVGIQNRADDDGQNAAAKIE